MDDEVRSDGASKRQYRWFIDGNIDRSVKIIGVNFSRGSGTIYV